MDRRLFLLGSLPANSASAKTSCGSAMPKLVHGTEFETHQRVERCAVCHPSRKVGDQRGSKLNGWCFQEHNTLVLGGERKIIGSQKFQNGWLEEKVPRRDEEGGHAPGFTGRMGSR